MEQSETTKPAGYEKNVQAFLRFVEMSFKFYETGTLHKGYEEIWKQVQSSKELATAYLTTLLGKYALEEESAMKNEKKTFSLADVIDYFKLGTHERNPDHRLLEKRNKKTKYSKIIAQKDQISAVDTQTSESTNATEESSTESSISSTKSESSSTQAQIDANFTKLEIILRSSLIASILFVAHLFNFDDEGFSFPFSLLCYFDSGLSLT